MTLSRAKSGKRPGFSLLEVLVAMAIFLLGLVAIGQLITMGGERALDVQQQSQAIQLCQAKMAEVVAGAVPLGSQSDAPFEEESDWTWSMDAQQQGAANLWTVKITVSRPGTAGTKVEASLSQMVFDPSQRGSTLDIAAAASAVAQANSTANASGSSSSQGSGGMSQSTGGSTPNSGITALPTTGGSGRNSNISPAPSTTKTNQNTPAPKTNQNTPAPKTNQNTPTPKTNQNTPTKKG